MHTLCTQLPCDPTRLRVGERFNPWNGFLSIHVPLGVLTFRELGEGAKLLYGRLLLYAGKVGRAYPSEEQLAEELGKSKDTIGRWTKELEKHRLIERIRRGPHTWDYYFLVHPLLLTCLKQNGRSITGSPLGQPSAAATSQRSAAETHRHDSAELPVANKEEKIQSEMIQEIESSSSIEGTIDNHAQPRKRPKADVRSRTKELRASEEEERTTTRTPSKNQEKIYEIISAFFRERGFRQPSENMPAEAIGRLLTQSGAEVRDLEALLTQYGERLVDPPSTWKHLLVSIENSLSSPKMKAEIQQRHNDERIVAEERRKKAAYERQMDTVMNLSEVIAFLKREHNCLPAEFIAGLERKGVKQISPRDLVALSSEWQRKTCQTCKKTGLAGSAAKQSLAYCTCDFGIERKQYEPKIVAEILAEVSRSFQVRLARAFQELDHLFAMDALQASNVVETEGRIEIRVPSHHMLALKDRQLRSGLDYLGETRSVELICDDATGLRMDPDIESIFGELDLVR